MKNGLKLPSERVIGRPYYGPSLSQKEDIYPGTCRPFKLLGLAGFLDSQIILGPAWDVPILLGLNLKDKLPHRHPVS